MKIDVHTHTKKTKSGDASTRNISPEEFCQVITSTDVKIIAITNHNVFDKKQYDEIFSKLDEGIQVWPGIELDIVENGRRGHLLVIVSPQKAGEFSQIVNDLTAMTNPDSFGINIQKTIDSFDHLGPLYIAHYHKKKPDLSDEDLNAIIERTANKNRVIKEVSNAISAGIFIEHGYPSIYGSDIHDWNQYVEKSKDLPDLRFPVESFEHFCLLLEKDPQAINTLLDKKTPENLILKPFEDSSKIELKCFNDINILFGSKGTGKTKILQAIERHYSEKGISAKVFTPSAEKLEDQYDLKGAKCSILLENYGISYCGEAISNVKNATEQDIVSLDNYIQYFDTEITNKSAKRILLKDFEPVDESEASRKFQSYYESLKKLDEFSKFVATDSSLREVSSSQELDDLAVSIGVLYERLRTESLELFISWKQSLLFNNAIKKIKKEVSRKTGTPEKPMSTGLKEYAQRRISIEVSTNEILLNLNKEIEIPDEYIGFLGEDKGRLYCRTKIIFQTGGVTDARFSPIAKINKRSQKEFSKAIEEIKIGAYMPDLFERISSLNKIDQIDEITSLSKLILFNRSFVVDDESYQPSSGECSMLLLHKELEADKDVYILDEPERSLGNDYISNVIVPLIKEKAKRGKKIFISTHDANIAVRTMPYNSIYRTHGPDGYKTYIGNPFSNNLINMHDKTDQIDWKQISMKTLEGGKEAFGERGKIYGEF